MKQPQPAPAAAPDLACIAEPLRPLAVPVADLRPDPKNARKHDAENIGGIKASLLEYGQRKPIVVNKRDNTIEAGNGTLEAAIALGWTHLAAVFVDDDPSKAAGFSIADNRTAELAEWDSIKLDELLRQVETGSEDLAKMLDELAKDAGIVPGEDSGPSEIDVPDMWQVVAEVGNEAEQKKLYDRLTKEGYKCRLLTL